MNLQLRRVKFLPNSTIGWMFVDNDYFCFTLEDTVRPPGIKIPGKTAIPAGRYRIVLYDSPRFKREVLLLLNVPGYGFIEIHSGNTDADTEGCIIVGGEVTENWTIEGGTSRPALERLMAKIVPVIDAGEEVWIEIRNEDLPPTPTS